MHVRVLGNPLPPAHFAGAAVLGGMQFRREVPSAQPVPDASDTMEFEAELEVIESPSGVDFAGPWVHGRRGDRFLYLSWGHDVDGRFVMFRRAKLMLDALDSSVIQALTDDATLVASLSLVDERGGPVCAAIRPPAIRWSVER